MSEIEPISEQRNRSELQAWRDPETLDYLYNGKGLVQHEIGDLLGCHQTTVKDWMKRVDVDFDTDWKAERPPWFGTTPDGYEVWDHTSHGDKFEVSVHRLLAVSQWGLDAIKDKVVHHINGIPWDNRVENIELLTPGGHMKKHASEGAFSQKLTPEDVRQIRRLRGEGKKLSEIADMFDVHLNNIWLIEQGEIWAWVE